MNTLPYKWITVVEISTDISVHGIKCCHMIICCTRYDCLRKTAHIKMSKTSPSVHFLEEKRSVYTFVCVRVTRLLFEHPSPAVMAGFDVPRVTSPLHLPCHNPISLSCLHSLRFPLTRGMCPSQLISILSPPFISSPHDAFSLSSAEHSLCGCMWKYADLLIIRCVIYRLNVGLHAFELHIVDNSSHNY